MKSFCIYILFLFVFINSCKTIKDKKYYSKKLEMVIGSEITLDFTIVDYNQSFAFGDYSEIFEMKFNELAFNKLYSKLVKLDMSQINDSTYQIKKIVSNNEEITILVFPNSKSIRFTIGEL